MKKAVLVLSSVLALPFLFSSCGGDSINALLDTIPSIAITSPTAGSGSSSVSMREGFWAAETGVPSDQKKLSQMLSDFEAKKDLPARDIASGVSLGFVKYMTKCYGPSITWDMSAPTDPAARNLPGGDLGIWLDTEDDGTACAAAQLNSLVGGANQINEARDFLLSIVAAAGADGAVGLPGVGASVDLTSSAPTFTGITVTSAILERLADDSAGNAVYKTHVLFTTASTLTGTYMTLYHSPVGASGQKGLFQGVFISTSQGGSPTDVYRGVSLIYNDDGTTLSFDLRAAQNRPPTSSIDFFSSTTGHVDATKTASGEDVTRFLATFNKTTNEGTARYAWLAGGNNDGSSRVFEVDVNVKADGKREGVGYFGFNEGLLGDLPATGTWITKFFPNWAAGGLSSGPEIINRCQGQTFLENSSGILAPVVTNSVFAPESDGLGTGTYIILPGTTSVSHTVTTHELIAPNSMGTVPDITAPTYTKP